MVISNIKYLVFSVLLLTGWEISAQNDLVLISELQFENNQEKSAYFKILNGEDAYLEALSHHDHFESDSLTIWEQNFQVVLDELKAKTHRRNNNIYLHKVYKTLHKKYLSQYKETVDPCDVFSTGVYNCVIATAIYAMAFEELQIPYQIKETPNHVYLIGKGMNGPVQFETTDPITGYRTFQADFRRIFAKHLLAQKTITKAEFDEGITEVFNNHYFLGENVTLQELVGIQYANEGIEQFENKAYEEAYESFEKAYLLYPSEKNTDLLYNTLATRLQNATYQNWSDVVLLSRAGRFTSYNINFLGVLSDFEKINNYYHLDKGDTAAFKKAYQLIKLGMPIEERVELDFFYHYERARVHYNRGDFEEALAFGLTAISFKPTNSEVAMLVLNSFRQFRRSPSPVILSVTEKVENLMERYPHINENKNFGGLLLDFYLVQMIQAYDAELLENAGVVRRQFNEMLSSNPEYQFDPYIAGRAYASGTYYHYKKGEFQTAHNLLDEGLKFAPYHGELINSKSLFKN